VARFNLAVALRQLGHLAEATTTARMALDLGALAAPTHCLLGVLCALNSDPKGAIAAYQTALKADPNNRVAWSYLGLAQAARGDTSAALGALARAIQDGPGRPLPRLVQSRLSLQRHALAQSGRAQRNTSLCAVAVITEVLHPDGTLVQPDEDTFAPDLRPGSAAVLDPEALAERVDAAARVVVLSGAGLSEESGLPTRKQLWEIYPRDNAVAVARFARDPFALWEAAAAFAGPDVAQPNAGHLVLARLPQVVGYVTQNVDNLHQRALAVTPGAGPCPVVELHGSFARVRCHDCGQRDGPSTWEMLRGGPRVRRRCPACDGALRPDVVLFGEAVPRRVLEDAVARVTTCDLLLVVGCAMDVAPASELPLLARTAGAEVIELNRSASRLGALLGLARCEGPAGETLRAMYTHLAARKGWPGVEFPAAVVRPTPLTRTITLESPRMGESTGTVLLRRWLVAAGDRVTQGQVVAEFDSDKVSIDLEAPCDGFVVRLAVPEESDVEMGVPIAEFVTQKLLAELPNVEIPERWRAVTSLERQSLPWSQEAQRVLLARLATWAETPWLRPDPALAALERDALLWLEDRVDELAASMLGGGDGWTLRVFRSGTKAETAWRDAWENPGDTTPWAQAVKSAEQQMLEAEEPPRSPNNPFRPGDLWPAAARQSKVHGVAESVWRAALRAQGLLDDTTEAAWPLPEPLFRDLLHHVYATTQPHRPLGPRVWAPWVAMLLRGAWPFALPPATVGVYVPVWRGETLVFDPEDPDHVASGRPELPKEHPHRSNVLTWRLAPLTASAPEPKPRG